MIKPKLGSLKMPSMVLTDEVIDTAPNRNPERTFEIVATHLEFYVTALNAEAARKKLLEYVSELNKKQDGDVRVGSFVIVYHCGDHAECNEGVR